MSEQSRALAEAFASLKALTEFYKHRFDQLLNMKGVRFDDDPKLIDVNETGFTLSSEYRCHDDTDYDETFFPWSDLDVDVADLNRRENERIATERAAARVREEAYKARQKYLDDERDKKEYVRLKAKFETAAQEVARATD